MVVLGDAVKLRPPLLRLRRGGCRGSATGGCASFSRATGDEGRLRCGQEEMEATRGRSSPTTGHGRQEKKLCALEL
jgi:hypothetical protein